MPRCDLLRHVGADSPAHAAIDGRGGAAAPFPAATVLYDDRAVTLDGIGLNPTHEADALWVRARDLPTINGFELHPDGACRRELCIPYTEDMVRGDFFNLTAFARNAGQAVVAEPGARVWSLGEMPARRAGPASRLAPDFEAADRRGRPVRLAEFLGKKVLAIAWASW